MAQMRYIVNDVDRAVEFYLKCLDFRLVQQFGPAMAIVQNDDVTLWLAGPASSAARPMPDGTKPTPGGWNRVVISVKDIEQTVQTLKAKGAVLRNDIVAGPGGRQIVCEDPSGNAVEIFQPS